MKNEMMMFDGNNVEVVECVVSSDVVVSQDVVIE
jgi:Zn ribbon nucleic-acid-binding protein